MKSAHTDGTEISEKYCSVRHKIRKKIALKNTSLRRQTAKKNQEDSSLVDINRKLITDDPENNIRNWFSNS